ncbi:MAG: hypothetical protein ACK5N0_01850 [Synechococcaceae cyanobacterium]
MPIRSLGLLALALLQIGVSLDPRDKVLRPRLRLFRQLAVLTALGFLLLLLLQLTAGLRLQKATSNAQIQRILGAEWRLVALRQATAGNCSSRCLSSGACCRTTQDLEVFPGKSGITCRNCKDKAAGRTHHPAAAPGQPAAVPHAAGCGDPGNT